jgi:hypothetical protein
MTVMTVFDPNAYRTAWSETFFSEQLPFEEWIDLWSRDEDLRQRLYGDGGIIAKSIRPSS